MRERDEKDSDSRADAEQTPDDVAALLSEFSHDFATPLANIKLAAEVLISAEGRVAEEQLANLGQKVSGEADRLRRMIETLIEWNRLETGSRQLRKKWHLAEDLVGAAIRSVESLLDDQKVVVTIEPDMAFVRGDEVLVETVVANLVENAANYSPRGEDIKIDVRADQTGCTFEVRDAGPLFDDEGDVPVDARCSARAGQTGTPGGGLGLVVSRMIVEAHDGEIWARNENDESGAVFAFVLGYGEETPPPTPTDVPLGDDGTN